LNRRGSNDTRVAFLVPNILTAFITPFSIVRILATVTAAYAACERTNEQTNEPAS
jgi:hypothetical protein